MLMPELKKCLQVKEIFEQKKKKINKKKNKKFSEEKL